MKKWLLLCLLVCRVASAQTLSPETTAKLQALVEDKTLTDARIGVSVLALGKAANAQSFPSQAFAAPKELFARDANKRFTPASNMKLYTAALALKVLGPNRKFTTRVRAQGQIKNGTLFGTLLLEGAGDPSLDFADLNNLAQQVRAAGIRRIEQRNPVLARSGRYRNGGIAENIYDLYPDGWTLDDARWYYGPEVTLLSLHRNQIDVTITGGDKTGDPASAALEEGDSGIGLNTVSDEAAGSIIDVDVKTGTGAATNQDPEDFLRVERMLGTSSDLLLSIIKISGVVAPKQKVTVGLAVPLVSDWAAQAFTNELRKVGVQIPDTDAEHLPGVTLVQGPVVASHESPPVSVLLNKFLKSSDNLYGELLLRLAARADLSQKGKSLNTNLAAHGHELLRNYLQSENIDTISLRFSDGSGLSRYNLLTPHATSQLLAAAERLPGAQSFWDALPIAGIDGTLRRRMMGTPAQNNARAKTGTFSIVSSLSGYVTTRDGTRCAVSVLTNFASGNEARRVQNAIFETLADATLAP
ncbi:MAG TPA: D-alanyl-D-alanine carboxypeptidase/D-alanyl-D-alanine-endopeptidase [Abditibacteriaceae bacterium]|jgi:D-alanyl-D-alanine carboxypeptidase/D-alanyl-D-alanine-endopeptidase (penicillin-binding protein 4)